MRNKYVDVSVEIFSDGGSIPPTSINFPEGKIWSNGAIENRE